MKPFRQPTPLEFFEENQRGFRRIKVRIFLCGKGISKKKESRQRSQDLRTFLKRRLEDESIRCEVWLGEHRDLIRAYRQAVGGSGNLADYEFSLAHSKKTDLVIIFPSGPGSFAELGMFCRAKKIAPKMTIFVDRGYRGTRAYIMAGAVEAAKIRRSQILFVDYRNREHVWRKVKEIVLNEREKKRAEALDLS
jgi:hypothetical protein